MSDTLITIIAIFLAAILMFIFPLLNITVEHDKTVQTVVDTLTSDYVNKIAQKGLISLEDYNTFIEKLYATRKYI